MNHTSQENQPGAAAPGSEATPPEKKEGAAPAGAAPEKKGGDLAVALRQEREKVRDLSKQLAAAASPSAAKVEIPDDVLVEPAELEKLVDAKVDAKLRHQEERRALTREFEEVIGGLEVFTTPEDPQLAADARAALESRLKALPPGQCTREAILKAAEEEARRFEGYLVAKLAEKGRAKTASEDSTRREPAPPGPGSVAAAHQVERPKSTADARSKAMDIARAFAKKTGMTIG